MLVIQCIDVYRLHQDHLDMIEDPWEQHKRLVELNVVEQCVNLYKTSIVQKKRYETSKENNPEGKLAYSIHIYLYFFFNIQ